MSKAPDSPNWYYAKDGNAAGPVSLAKLVDMMKSGSLSPETLVIEEGKTEWHSLNVVIDINTMTPESRELDIPTLKPAREVGSRNVEKIGVHPARKGCFGCLALGLVLLMIWMIIDKASSKPQSDQNSKESSNVTESDSSNITGDGQYQNRLRAAKRLRLEFDRGILLAVGSLRKYGVKESNLSSKLIFNLVYDTYLFENIADGYAIYSVKANQNVYGGRTDEYLAIPFDSNRLYEKNSSLPDGGYQFVELVVFENGIGNQTQIPVFKLMVPE